MGLQKVVSELNCWCLGDSVIAVNHVGELVSDQKEACLTIDASCIHSLLLVLGHHLCEIKVNAQSLVWCTDLKWVLTRCNLLQLGLDTGSAFQDGTQWLSFEVRDAIATLMGLSCDNWGKMAQSMVPKLSFCFGSQLMDGCVLKDEFTVGVISIRWGKLIKFVSEEPDLFQLVSVNSLGSFIIAQLVKGRIICFSFVDKFMIGGNGMILGWDWRYDGISVCTAKADDSCDDKIFTICLFVMTSHHNLPSIRCAMLFKLDYSIQCIVWLSLSWVEVLLNSQSRAIITHASGMDEVLFIEKG